jgi:hypothetical protein
MAESSTAPGKDSVKAQYDLDDLAVHALASVGMPGVREATHRGDRSREALASRIAR